jgi:hypothetical protein
MVKTATIYAAVCVLAASLACSVSAPLTPAPATSTERASASDGSTLKVGAPILVSPVNGQQVTGTRATLTITTAVGQFAAVTPQHEFELMDDAGAVIARQVQSELTWTVDLDAGRAYQWRARGVSGGAAGPYAPTARFQTAVANIACFTDKFNKTSVSDWFFRVANAVGAQVNSRASRDAMIPLFTQCGVAWQNQARGDTRARFFLPPLQQPNLDSPWYVDTGDEGRAFNLTFRY